MIGYLGFHEARHRLLAVVHGERALKSASIYRRVTDGLLRLELPEPPWITEDECRAATDALVLSLRAGENEAIVEVDGLPQRVEFWYWYPHPTPDELHGLDLRDQHGRPILLDRGRFETWLSISNVIEALKSLSEERLEAPASEASNAKPPTAPTVDGLVAFLDSIADGAKSEATCKTAAENHFKMQIPLKRVWRKAWGQVDRAKKLGKGETEAAARRKKLGKGEKAPKLSKH
jgi:hypothetical protein